MSIPSGQKTEPQTAVGSSAFRRRVVRAGLGAGVVLGCALMAGLVFRPWSAPPSLSSIDTLITRQQWGQAERQLRRYRGLHPNDPQPILLLSRLHGSRSEYPECARVLETVPADAVERAEALWRAGQAWSLANLPRESERVWIECLAGSGADLSLPMIQQECRRELCKIYATEQRRDSLWEMTWKMYERAAPRDRHVPLAMRARYEFEMIDPAVLITSLELALKNDPQDRYTRRALGLNQLEAGRTEPARANLYECVQQAPDDVLMWEAWLACLYRTADMFGLQRAVQQLPDSASGSAECWKFRLILAERDGEIEQAIQAAEQAGRLRPWEPEYRHRLGQLLVRAGKTEQGKEMLDRNHELQEATSQLRDAFEAYRVGWSKPSTPRTMLAYRMAESYEKLARLQEAAAWLRVVLAEDPAHAASIAALERIQADLEGADAAPGQ